MKRGKSEKGQSLLEFALILPVLLIVLAGLLDLGRLYFAYVAVTDAAGEGAAYGAIHPDETDEIIQRAQEATRGMVEIEEDMISIAQEGQAIAVTVRYEFTLATPLIGEIVPEGALTLTAVAVEHKVIID